VKKNNNISLEDYKEWKSYTQEMKDVYDKDKDFIKNKIYKDKILTVDLHGLSLINANQTIEKIINDSYRNSIRKIKVITGKGNRSTVKDNPYSSSELGILKNSVPNFIKNKSDLFGKIKKIERASLGDGGEGAFYILLKKIKE
jgi:DNA-nicking Smr family endonuclease